MGEDPNVSTLYLLNFPKENYFRQYNLTSEHSFKMIWLQAIALFWHIHRVFFSNLNEILIMLLLIRMKERHASVFFAIIDSQRHLFVHCKYEYSCKKLEK